MALDRREFLRLSATGALSAAALGAGAAGAIGQAADRTLRIGVIGCGGIGNAHLNILSQLKKQGEPVEIAAVCDVYQVRVDAAARRVGARPYANYRELLAAKDIDAVTVATPDHWHARITCDAADAGKDVYCEKPMTYWKSLDYPKEVVKAVARNDRVMQVGTQYMSDDVWDVAGARIKAGALGGLVHAQASDMRNGPIGVYSPLSNDGLAKPGENLDWDMWLGPAPKVPWEPGRYFAFRAFWDYSGGIGTDFFPHILTPLVYTMGLTFPHRVTASGGLYQWSDGRQVPDIFTMCIEYPGGPSLVLSAALSNNVGMPMMIRGKKGTLYFEGPGAVIEPQRDWDPDGKREEIARTRGMSHEGHFKNWLDCIRTRQKPRSNEVLGYHVMTALHMGITSYLTGRTMEFDPEKEIARPV